MALLNQPTIFGQPVGNNPNDNFLPDPMGLRPQMSPPVQYGGPQGGFDMEMQRRMANKALHSAKTPQQRQAAAANLAGIRNQINQGRLSQNLGYNEGRDAGRIAQDVGTPGVRRINPGQPNYGGQPGSSQPGMPGQGGGGMNPGMGGTNGDPYSMLSNVYNQTTQGTINSFNTSANRLRERLDAQTRGNQNTAVNRNLGRGFGPSGATDADIYRTQAAGQNAYAQGLNDLSNQFEQNRLQGLNTALGAATSTREGQEENNRLGFNYANMNNVLLNNREQRSNDNANSDKDRSLQQQLAELLQKNENLRTVLGLGDNKNPQVVPGLSGSVGSGSHGSIIAGLPNPNQPNTTSPIYSLNGNLNFPNYF